MASALRSPQPEAGWGSAQSRAGVPSAWPRVWAGSASWPLGEHGPSQNPSGPRWPHPENGQRNACREGRLGDPRDPSERTDPSSVLNSIRVRNESPKQHSPRARPRTQAHSSRSQTPAHSCGRLGPLQKHRGPRGRRRSPSSRLPASPCGQARTRLSLSQKLPDHIPSRLPGSQGRVCQVGWGPGPTAKGRPTPAPG